MWPKPSLASAAPTVGGLAVGAANTAAWAAPLQLPAWNGGHVMRFSSSRTQISVPGMQMSPAQNLFPPWYVKQTPFTSTS